MPTSDLTNVMIAAGAPEMSRSLSIHEAAEDEISEAADFYDLENPGFGDVFINEVEKIIEDIVMYPEAAPIIQGRVRRKTMTKFPFSLIYSVREAQIRMLAVAHHKRRPFYWRGRS